MCEAALANCSVQSKKSKKKRVDAKINVVVKGKLLKSCSLDLLWDSTAAK